MAGRYEPLRIYDAPDVIFTQAMQGELSYKTVMNTMLRPSHLSLEERDSFADQMKDAMGNHSITNTMVDVMKNPFFWLLFLTSPVATPALKGGKKILFDRGVQLSAYMKENPPLLGALQLLTANEYFSGTALGSVIGHISKLLDDMQRELGTLMSGPFTKFKVDNKLKTLDPALEANPRRKALLEKLHSALFAAMTHAHKDVEVLIARSAKELDIVKYAPDEGLAPGKEVGKHRVQGQKNIDATIKRHDEMVEAGRHPDFHYSYTTREGEVLNLKFDKEKIAGWGGQDPFKVLEEMGAMDLFRALDESRKIYLKRVFLTPYVKGMSFKVPTAKGHKVVKVEKPDVLIKEGSGATSEWAVDVDKVLNLYRAQRNEIFSHMKLGMEASDPVATRGMGIIHQLMDKETAEAMWVNMLDASAGVLKPGSLTPERFYGVVRELLSKTLRPETYLPRNMLEVLDASGKVIPPDVLRGMKRGQIIFATGKAAPRAKADMFWSPADMEAGQRALGWDSPAFLKLMERNKLRLEGRLKAPGEGGMGEAIVHRIDPVTAMERYTKDMNESYSLFIAPVAKETMEHQERYWEALKKLHPKHRGLGQRHGPTMTGGQGAQVGTPFSKVKDVNKPMGYFNNADALFAEYHLMGNQHAQRMLSEILLPTALGRLTSAQGTGLAAAWSLQHAARGIRALPFRKMIEDSGEWGKHFYSKLDMAADLPLEKILTSREIANWLYVTHLGVNMSSVLLNLMQPFLMGGPMVGMSNLMHGYKEAFRELGVYFKNRKGMGLRISDVQKEDVIRKSFKWANYEGRDLLDIHPNIHHTVDAIMEGQMSYVPPSWKEYLLKDAPMKMFEKAEWLNRLVMSHATENMVRTANPLMAEADIARNVHDFVRQTQYGAHVMNTPLGLLPHMTAEGTGRSRWLLSDPTWRQFVTFPLRTFTGFAYAPKLLATGEKTGMAKWAGKKFGLPEERQLEISSWWPLLVANMRAMGYGAVAYEVGRDMIGADVSRGMYPQAALDIIQGDRFIEGTESAFPLQIPPVFDIGMGFGQWVTNPGDAQVLSRWLSRVVPGGVGIRRLTSLIPSPDQDYGLGRFARQMQSFYVGWDEPRVDGLVPVYKPDGTLVSYQKPTTMILRALGMDMRKFATEAQMDRWLAKNRDEASRIKRGFITAVLNGDWSWADRLNEQYQKKFDMPIRLTRQQLASQMRTRTITRTERLLDRMSPDLRERYLQAIQHKAPQLGLSPEQLGKTTSSQRTEAGAQRPTPLTPEAQRYLEAYMTQDPSGVFRRFGASE
jgi:hypothetical protein